MDNRNSGNPIHHSYPLRNRQTESKVNLESVFSTCIGTDEVRKSIETLDRILDRYDDGRDSDPRQTVDEGSARKHSLPKGDSPLHMLASCMTSRGGTARKSFAGADRSEYSLPPPPEHLLQRHSSCVASLSHNLTDKYSRVPPVIPKRDPETKLSSSSSLSSTESAQLPNSKYNRDDIYESLAGAGSFDHKRHPESGYITPDQETVDSVFAFITDKTAGVKLSGHGEKSSGGPGLSGSSKRSLPGIDSSARDGSTTAPPRLCQSDLAFPVPPEEFQDVKNSETANLKLIDKQMIKCENIKSDTKFNDSRDKIMAKHFRQSLDASIYAQSLVVKSESKTAESCDHYKIVPPPPPSSLSLVSHQSLSALPLSSDGIDKSDSFNTLKDLITPPPPEDFDFPLPPPPISSDKFQVEEGTATATTPVKFPPPPVLAKTKKQSVESSELPCSKASKVTECAKISKVGSSTESSLPFKVNLRSVQSKFKDEAAIIATMEGKCSESITSNLETQKNINTLSQQLKSSVNESTHQSVSPMTSSGITPLPVKQSIPPPVMAKSKSNVNVGLNLAQPTEKLFNKDNDGTDRDILTADEISYLASLSHSTPTNDSPGSYPPPPDWAVLGLSSDKSTGSTKDLPFDITKVSGYQEVPLNCPQWKKALIDKKNKQLEEVAMKEYESKKQEQERWRHIPEWKKNLIMEKEKKKQDESVSTIMQKAQVQGDMTRLQNLSEWKRNLVLKRRNEET